MNKKKIGILNFQYSTHNYGAVLQAAALEFILNAEGHEVEHINYIPSRRNLNIKSMVKKALVSIGVLKEKQKLKPQNSEVFEKFRVGFLTRSSRIETAAAFSKLAGKYDTVVVGSDQVWRPRMAADPAAFFLAYVPAHVSRISYAASFGAAEWEPDINAPVTELAKIELAKFSAISCRETSGVEICKSVFGVAALHVLDPLLQVSDEFIDSVINSAQPSNQKLVYYKLDHDEKFSLSIEALERQLGTNARNIYRRNGSLNEYEEVAQWLRNIYDADVVVSDSFHCICLALRFGKEVIYCPNEKRGQARLDSLFSSLSISVPDVGLQLPSPMFRLSKQGNIKIILETERRHSTKFLKEALDD